MEYIIKVSFIAIITTAELLGDLGKDGNDCYTLNALSDRSNIIENQLYLEEEPT